MEKNMENEMETGTMYHRKIGFSVEPGAVALESSSLVRWHCGIVRYLPYSFLLYKEPVHA